MYDIAVIGGGPSGMMSAGQAGLNDAKVVLIEKNFDLGRKLLMTGKRRCNITNAEPDKLKFIEAYGKNGKFLLTALNTFSNLDVIDFFEKKGIPTKVENNNKVFPVSDRGEDVLNCLIKFLKENNVEILYGKEVKNIIKKGNHIEKIELKNSEIKAKNYIIATGGLSFPLTGATGDGYKWAKELEHTIIEPRPSLIPVLTKELWVKDAQGVSLKDVKISIFQNNKKKDERTGEALFTHEGMSGPIIIKMSKNISNLLKDGEVDLRIDFEPKLTHPEVDEKIRNHIQKTNKQIFRNLLFEILPRKLVGVFIEILGIKSHKPLSELTKEERKKLVNLLKEFKMGISGLSGFNKAIITTGGIALNEINPKTMKSKIIDNLYFAGEVIDVDGTTGGFNLQNAWSTGYLAGKSASHNS